MSTLIFFSFFIFFLHSHLRPFLILFSFSLACIYSFILAVSGKIEWTVKQMKMKWEKKKKPTPTEWNHGERETTHNQDVECVRKIVSCYNTVRVLKYGFGVSGLSSLLCCYLKHHIKSSHPPSHKRSGKWKSTRSENNILWCDFIFHWINILSLWINQHLLKSLDPATTRMFARVPYRARFGVSFSHPIPFRSPSHSNPQKY